MTPNTPYRYAYTSCVPVSLEVTSEHSPLHGRTVTLLGRYITSSGVELLLVRQTAPPQLIELPAAYTNLDTLGPLPPVDDRKLVAERLFDAVQILEAMELDRQVEGEQPEL